MLGPRDTRCTSIQPADCNARQKQKHLTSGMCQKHTQAFCATYMYPTVLTHLHAEPNDNPSSKRTAKEHVLCYNP
jgi:hypothetical protein